MKNEPPLKPWPASKVELWPIKKLKAYPRNARLHSEAQVDQIAKSMQRFGVTAPLLVDEDGVLIYGHGRLRAAVKLGYTELPVSVAIGWTTEEKSAYRIADNQIALNSEWDIPLLTAELKDLVLADFDMPLLGFDEVKLTEFVSGLPSEDDEDAERGKLLDLVNVTVAEPDHEAATGEHYLLDNRHHLICASVISDWAVWSPLLKGDALFCPYAGVFVVFGSKAKEHPLVMVQPDPYIVGHILDRYAEVVGKKKIKKVEP